MHVAGFLSCVCILLFYGHIIGSRSSKRMFCCMFIYYYVAIDISFPDKCILWVVGYGPVRAPGSMVVGKFL